MFTPKYPIAIITYRRPERQLTLEYLQDIAYPKELIYLFVQTKEDYITYQRHTSHAHLCYLSGNNVAQNRNNCLRYFRPGQRILQFDDDMKYLAVLHIPSGRSRDRSAYKLRKVNTLQEFVRIIDIGFTHMERLGTVLWGMYPVCNPYFMRRSITDWAVVVGKVMGIQIDTQVRFDEALPHKSDFDYSCQVLRRYGAVIRFDGIVPYYADRQPDALTRTDRYTAAMKAAAKRCLRRNKDLLMPKTSNPYECRLKTRTAFYRQF